MVKKVQMYAERFAARYDPHSNPVCVCVCVGGGGSSPPTALSKVGKYDLMLISSNLIGRVTILNSGEICCRNGTFGMIK